MKLTLFAAAISLIGASAAWAQPAVQPAPEMARGADSFVDAVGVSTHWGYKDTPYFLRYAEASRLMGESNTRHIRDRFELPEWDLFNR